MRRLGLLLAFALAIGLVAGCGDETETRAYEAFQALAARPNLAYRMRMRTTMPDPPQPGQPNGPNVPAISEVEIVVVGADLSMSTGPADGAPQIQAVVVGGNSFMRAANGEWTRMGPDTGQGAVTSILPGLASALGPSGVIEHEGRRLYRLVSRGPFDLLGGSNTSPSTQVSAAELLIDGEGRPVQALLEAGPGGSDDFRLVVSITFTDVDSPLTIEVPVVP